MRSTPYIVLAILLSFALGIFLAGTSFYHRDYMPLTNAEKQFVGTWLHTEGQKEEPGAGITLKPDRTFLSNSQQFYGTWAVVSGKLHIDYTGVRNWVGNSLIEKLLHGMKSQPQNINQFDMTFGPDGSSLKLVASSDSTVSKLVRVGD
jgi:hypothetical protein